MTLLISIALAVAALTFLATTKLIVFLHRIQSLDRPNDRSSHAIPTPRGAGLAIVPIIALAWIAIGFLRLDDAATSLIWVATGAAFLCCLSWFDDLKGLSPLVRFGAHILVVAGLLMIQSSDALYAQGLLPLWADRLVAGFVWVWFINLFNFMDGIDGISGVETLSIAIGLMVFAVFVPSVLGVSIPASVLVGAAAGFLLLNWHPAKIFLGNSGSVPLGLLLGWLLLQLAADGYWAVALILPLYYITDATITILLRIGRGEKIWQAHRQHFYQRAVAGGLSHARVALMIALANVALIVLAVLSISYLIASLIGAGLVVVLLLAALQRRAVAP